MLCLYIINNLPSMKAEIEKNSQDKYSLKSIKFSCSTHVLESVDCGHVYMFTIQVTIQVDQVT